ncbi:unnamed protein product [Vitrella brassicaformis CCMP3155]|uniref:DJ-1/PfpI domain-containing protein n=2 Tax=Vitrella brassicaformis TaxID=1169539 RepID=A0A0G4E938_VITBC|nr:unnamed protein product [Vitrella brassicaformis CCMP3155]|eukprot:CEL92431.1 unnamed protein product [Vitrella brassicaformis CCMP3155]
MHVKIPCFLPVLLTAVRTASSHPSFRAGTSEAAFFHPLGLYLRRAQPSYRQRRSVCFMAGTGGSRSVRVLVPVADGSEEIEAVCIIDTLVRAGAKVTVSSVMGRDDRVITASRGVKIQADSNIDDVKDEDFDMIILPGGMPGATHLRDCATLTEMLKKQRQAKQWYGAICAAPSVVLESHGLLEGEKATGYPNAALEITNRVDGPRVVISNNVITSMGPGSALEFALACVENLFDADTALKLKDEMLVGSYEPVAC